jgi:hypothetical protein
MVLGPEKTTGNRAPGQIALEEISSTDSTVAAPARYGKTPEIGYTAVAK